MEKYERLRFAVINMLLLSGKRIYLIIKLFINKQIEK